MHARRVHDGSGYAVVDTRILRRGERVADARLTMRNVPFPSTALEEHVRREGRRMGCLTEAGA